MSGIVRVQKHRGYSVIDNSPINDRRLGWDSLGLLTYLLSKPDGWEIRNRQLIEYRDAGEHKIKRMLKELRDFGYIWREMQKDANGRFVWVSTVYENPVDNHEWQKKNSIGRKSPDGNPDETTGRFSVDGSSVDGSSVDGKPPDIVNTDQSITDKVSTDGIDIDRVATDSEINVLITALSGVCKEVLVVGENESKFENYSLTLFTLGATAVSIKNFGEWWANNGWHNQRPVLKNIVDHWEDFKLGKCLRKSSNGNGADRDAQIRAAVEAAQGGW